MEKQSKLSLVKEYITIAYVAVKLVDKLIDIAPVVIDFINVTFNYHQRFAYVGK